VIEMAGSCFLLANAGPGGLAPLGTGFALGGRRIATALHVVGVAATNVHLVMPEQDAGGYQDTTRSEFRALPLQMIAADPIHDLAVLELPDIAETTVPYAISGTDAVRPGAPVVSVGYPHADTGRFVLVQHPSTVGARILMSSQGIKSKHLVLNTLAKQGQSGSPVFDSAIGSVVAVLIGPYAPDGPRAQIMIGNLDPATIHQTTHAVSAEYLQAMLA
jgi:S1-C subfamily serine protease